MVKRLLPLAVRSGCVVTLVDNKILRPVIKAAREVAIQDGLGALGIANLGINGATRHVRNHGVATTPWVLGITERVVFGSGLREPNVSSVASQLARLEGLGDILLHDDGTASSVDKPSTLRKLAVLFIEFVQQCWTYPSSS